MQTYQPTPSDLAALRAMLLNPAPTIRAAARQMAAQLGINLGTNINTTARSASWH